MVDEPDKPVIGGDGEGSASEAPMPEPAAAAPGAAAQPDGPPMPASPPTAVQLPPTVVDAAVVGTPQSASDHGIETTRTATATDAAPPGEQDADIAADPASTTDADLAPALGAAREAFERGMARLQRRSRGFQAIAAVALVVALILITAMSPNTVLLEASQAAARPHARWQLPENPDEQDYTVLLRDVPGLRDLAALPEPYADRDTLAGVSDEVWIDGRRAVLLVFALDGSQAPLVVLRVVGLDLHERFGAPDATGQWQRSMGGRTIVAFEAPAWANLALAPRGAFGTTAPAEPADAPIGVLVVFPLGHDDDIAEVTGALRKPARTYAPPAPEPPAIHQNTNS